MANYNDDMNKPNNQKRNLVLKWLLVAILLAPVNVLHSQELVKVEGDYVYYAPENTTVEEAKNTALTRAKIQALADAFGTIVSQTNSTHINNDNGNTSTNFLSIGVSDVKGEWIETIGEPEYKVEYKQNILVVSVKVRGRARELISKKAEIDTKILRNGTEDKYEDSNFRNGDDLFVSFQSPIDGYLAIYLVDSEPRAYCLLPYREQTNGIYHVEANKRYVFFNKTMAGQNEKHLVDEYVMTCAGSSEHNQIYIVFSPNQFVKANDINSSNSLPRELDNDDFIRWLSKNRRLDTQLNCVMIPITIKK